MKSIITTICIIFAATVCHGQEYLILPNDEGTTDAVLLIDDEATTEFGVIDLGEFTFDEGDSTQLSIYGPDGNSASLIVEAGDIITPSLNSQLSSIARSCQSFVWILFFWMLASLALRLYVIWRKDNRIENMEIKRYPPEPQENTKRRFLDFTNEEKAKLRSILWKEYERTCILSEERRTMHPPLMSQNEREKHEFRAGSMALYSYLIQYLDDES